MATFANAYLPQVVRGFASPLDVSVVRPSDVLRLAEHFSTVAEEPLFVMTQSFPRSFEQTQEFVEQILESRSASLFVARVATLIVGHCLIRASDFMAMRHVGKVSLAVSPEFRRRGVGYQLLELAEDWAKVHGLRKLTLDVLANNRPALRLYEKRRYREEGARRDQVWIDGDFHDELLLAKFL